MKRPFAKATAAALALAVFSLALLIAVPPALVSGLRAAQRFLELGFHFAAASTLLDHFQAWLWITAPCVFLLAALAWLATRPWSDAETAHTGSGRLRLLWPLALIFVGFECYRQCPAAPAEIARALDALVLLALVGWVVMAPRVAWRTWLASSWVRGLRYVGLLVMLVWGGSQVALLTHALGPRSGHPNLVWIVIDGLRADRVGPQPDGSTHTPALDAFARESISFRWALAQTSWTHTSLGSMLTSRHPAEFGWDGSADAVELGGDTIYIAELLKQAGYRTHAILSDPETAKLPALVPGFDRLDTSLVTGERAKRLDDRVTDRGLRALDAAGARPFFLLLEYTDPEPPYLVEASLREELEYEGPLSSGDSLETLRLYSPHMSAADRHYWQSAYLAEVRRTDAAVGRFLDALRESPAYDDTVVIVTAPHGAIHFERGFSALEARQGIFAESIRVPLMLRYPGYAEGVSVSHAVQLTDLVPTLHQHLGFEIPTGYRFAGRAIDLSRIEQFDRLPPVPMYAETHYGSARWQAVNLGRWSYVRDPHSVRRFLFDIERDPAQRMDVAGAHADVMARLDPLLDAWVWDVEPQDIWPMGAGAQRRTAAAERARP